MNKNYTPFGYVPDQYLHDVCFWGGIRWDDEMGEYFVIAELKNGKKHRTARQLVGLKTEGKEKYYSIVPQFTAMLNYVKRNNTDWYKNINFGPEEEEIMQEIRNKKLVAHSSSQAENIFDET